MKIPFLRKEESAVIILDLTFQQRLFAGQSGRQEPCANNAGYSHKIKIYRLMIVPHAK